MRSILTDGVRIVQALSEKQMRPEAHEDSEGPRVEVQGASGGKRQSKLESRRDAQGIGKEMRAVSSGRLRKRR